ncbi:IclR family transcriptional regulator [Henriciella mobilis]|uniref:IclR family transcriptional regulator n=1 Tax=Henriciella mobilis TaxID=2305467 RepID=UPI001F425E06|nr:IclR family transcriptional regulator C-terminal domain-containing protein [Henriciella mobilis]
MARIAMNVTLHARLVRVAEVPLRRLAGAAKGTAHLGVLEGDMVTYLARHSVDPSFKFSQIGTQFEAYCTGIGKILLAGMHEQERDVFLANGPFVPITADTLTDPEMLRRDIEISARRGYAVDQAEMFEGVHCVAVPIKRNGDTIAAISLSRKGAPPSEVRRKRDLSRLLACADSISIALG